MTRPFSRRSFLGGLGGTVAGLSVAGLSGCGVSQDQADVALSDEDVTLRFTWWGSDSRHEVTQQAIEAFEQANPRITVKGEFADWTGYWDRLATTFAADDAADIVQMDELYLRTYADRGSLMDLTRTSDFLDLSGFDDVTLAAGQSGGTQYALPIGNGAMSVAADLRTLSKYGLELPDDTTWTWDDFADFANRVTEASGGKVVGAGAVGTEAGIITIYARQHGAQLFDDSGQVVLPAEVLAELWTLCRSMAGKGAPSAASSAEQLTSTLDQTWLVLGKQAMNFNYNTQISSLQEASKDGELVLLQLPRSADGSSTGFYYKPSMYWSIAAGSEHPAEAALFVDFLANSPDAAKILGTDRGIPASSEALAAIRPSLDETSELAAAFNDEVADLVSDPPALTPAGASDINNLVQRYLQEMLFDRQTPLEAAQGFVDELTAAVQDAT